MTKSATLTAAILGLTLLANCAEPVAEVTRDFSNLPPTPDSFIEILNAERTARRLRPVEYDATLSLAAQRHAEDMAARNYFAHRNPEGRDPFDRIQATGYEYCWAGENLAAGQPNMARAFDAWMKSASHRHAMLAHQPTEVGFAYVPDTELGAVWVLLLGRPGC